MKAVLLVAALPSLAFAQDIPTAPTSTAPALAQPAEIVLPARTEVTLMMANELTTKTAKAGDQFDMLVKRDVMVGDAVVIPRGTPAHGRVARKASTGAWGKPGKFDLEFVDIRLGERIIPLEGHQHVEGKGNRGAVTAVAILGGVTALAVRGHNAVVPAGSEWQAVTIEAASFTRASQTSAASGQVPATTIASATN